LTKLKLKAKKGRISFVLGASQAVGDELAFRIGILVLNGLTHTVWAEYAILGFLPASSTPRSSPNSQFVEDLEEKVWRAVSDASALATAFLGPHP